MGAREGERPTCVEGTSHMGFELRPGGAGRGRRKVTHDSGDAPARNGIDTRGHKNRRISSCFERFPATRARGSAAMRKRSSRVARTRDMFFSRLRAATPRELMPPARQIRELRRSLRRSGHERPRTRSASAPPFSASALGCVRSAHQRREAPLRSRAHVSPPGDVHLCAPERGEAPPRVRDGAFDRRPPAPVAALTAWRRRARRWRRRSSRRLWRSPRCSRSSASDGS
jgi:hypothetical protein